MWLLLLCECGCEGSAGVIGCVRVFHVPGVVRDGVLTGANERVSQRPTLFCFGACGWLPESPGASIYGKRVCMCWEYRFPCFARQHSCPLSCVQAPWRSQAVGRRGFVDKLTWLVSGPLRVGGKPTCSRLISEFKNSAACVWQLH